MGLFSGGKSWSTSDSYSGLRNTGYFNPLAGQVSQGFKFGFDVAKQRVGDTNPLGLQANGLTAAQSNAFDTLGKNLFSNISSNYASRGFLSPENVQGVIGSSMTQAAPQLIGQILQNQMGNQSVMSDRFSALRDLLSGGTSALGTEQHSKGVQTGPNMLGSALAQGIGSWTNLNSYANMVGALNSGSKGV